MRLKAVKDFYDLEGGLTRRKGELFTVTDARAQALIGAGVCAEAPEEPARRKAETPEAAGKAAQRTETPEAAPSAETRKARTKKPTGKK